MSLIYRSFQGVNLTFRQSDGYVNATALAKRYYERSGTRRNSNDWLRLKRTQETIRYVASIKDVAPDDLVRIDQGGSVPDEQGTFIHPELAIPFASWLSVEFEYGVTQIVLNRLSDQSRRETEDALRELIHTLQTYFQEAEGFGESIHATSHLQMGRIRAGLKLAQTQLEEMQMAKKNNPTLVEPVEQSLIDQP